ncbi:MAG TPA: hypothetical protein VMA83_10585 [Solirubrobacteraceae bacterium]|nr:hypothetical protein [Solirubrobacteraceae bacterium]
MPQTFNAGDRVAMQDWVPTRHDRAGTVDHVDVEGAVWVRWDGDGDGEPMKRYPPRALKPADA